MDKNTVVFEGLCFGEIRVSMESKLDGKNAGADLTIDAKGKKSLFCSE
jgi:hypothetical protein